MSSRRQAVRPEREAMRQWIDEEYKRAAESMERDCFCLFEHVDTTEHVKPQKNYRNGIRGYHHSIWKKFPKPSLEKVDCEKPHVAIY